MQSQKYVDTLLEKHWYTTREIALLTVCVSWGDGGGTERKVGDKSTYLDRFKLYETYVYKN